MAELLDRVGVAHRTHLRRRHLRPLLDSGLVRMTKPERPRASDQRYVLTEAGAAVRAQRLDHGNCNP